MKTVELRNAGFAMEFGSLAAEEDSVLHDFNQQVLACQDGAFTLAYYLLGEKELAGAAMQKAVMAIYLAKPKCTNELQLRLLREIIHSVQRNQRRGSGLKGSNASPALRLLQMLPISEKSAVVLVDVLGLDYREASTILGCSYRRLSKWITQGRRQMARDLEISTG